MPCPADREKPASRSMRTKLLLIWTYQLRFPQSLLARVSGLASKVARPEGREAGWLGAWTNSHPVPEKLAHSQRPQPCLPKGKQKGVYPGRKEALKVSLEKRKAGVVCIKHHPLTTAQKNRAQDLKIHIYLNPIPDGTACASRKLRPQQLSFAFQRQQSFREVLSSPGPLRALHKHLSWWQITS